MYWPIGAPRIYASSGSKGTKGRIIESDDDAESRETTEGSGSLLDAPSAGSGRRSEDGTEAHSGTSTPVSPVTSGIKPVEQAHTERYLSTRAFLDSPLASAALDATEKEHLLALRISRTGHLFAVITSTSLTIWQTKVCRPPSTIDLAQFNPANCRSGCCCKIQHISKHLR
jgi:hypothetical protein